MEDIDKVIEKVRHYLLTEKAKKQLKFYLHVRHMTSDKVRKVFLQGWLDSRKTKTRRGKKGKPYVF